MRLKVLSKIKKPSRLMVFSGISGLLLSLSFALGPLFTNGITSNSKLAFLFHFAIYLPIAWFAIFKLYTFLDKKERSRRRQRKVLFNKTHFSFKNFWLFFAIVLIPSIILLLSFWPGHFAYDVSSELLGGGVYTNHHPLIHTLWLHAIVKIGKMLSLSPNWTVGLMSISQIILCSVIYAYISEFFSRIISKKGGVLLALFLALLPASSFAMIAITKDTVHIAMFCLLITLTYRLFCLRELRKKDIILYVLFAAFFGITRHNSIYILGLFGVLCFFLLKKHRLRKMLTVSMFVSLILSLVFNYGLQKYTNAYTLQKSAAFSLPLQLVAGTIEAHPELIPEMDSGEKILGFFEYSSDVHNYDFFNKGSDRTKNNSYGKQIEGRTTEFLWLTFTTGLRYPMDYLRVFADQTLSSWYPFAYDFAYYYTWIDRADPATRKNFSETWTQQTKMLRGVKTEPAIPFLHDFLVYEYQELHYRDNPILLILCAPASYVLALIVLAFYLAYKKDKVLLLVTSLAICCYFIILIAAPCILIRYMLPLMLAVPMLYLLTLRSRAKLY